MKYNVVATVGTDNHPFDRLVSWIDQIALDIEADVFIQYGTSRPPRIAHGADYMTHAALGELISGASAVITHGGPATIMEARALHGSPIVVPRDPDRGEHVDGHQLEFCELMADKGVLILARTPGELADAINAHLVDPPVRPVASHTVAEGVTRFTELMDELLAAQAPARKRRWRP